MAYGYSHVRLALPQNPATSPDFEDVCRGHLSQMVENGAVHGPLLSGQSRAHRAARRTIRLIRRGTGFGIIGFRGRESSSYQRTGESKRPAPPLHDQHAIAVAVKAVALAHGFGVGAKDKFAAGEGGDEHQQCRFWKVKIGE